MLEHNHPSGPIRQSIKEHLAQAMGERDVDAYLDSRKLNLDCKKAIEEAIAGEF